MQNPSDIALYSQHGCPCHQLHYGYGKPECKGLCDSCAYVSPPGEELKKAAITAFAKHKNKAALASFYAVPEIRWLRNVAETRINALGPALQQARQREAAEAVVAAERARVAALQAQRDEAAQRRRTYFLPRMVADLERRRRAAISAGNMTLAARYAQDAWKARRELR